jgi:hypothetical protein
MQRSPFEWPRITNLKIYIKHNKGTERENKEWKERKEGRKEGRKDERKNDEWGKTNEDFEPLFEFLRLNSYNHTRVIISQLFEH